MPFTSIPRWLRPCRAPLAEGQKWGRMISCGRLAIGPSGEASLDRPITNPMPLVFPVMEFYTNCGAGFSACGLAFQRVQPAGRPACGHDWPPHNKCRMTVSEKTSGIGLVICRRLKIGLSLNQEKSSRADLTIGGRLPTCPTKLRHRHNRDLGCIHCIVELHNLIVQLRHFAAGIRYRRFHNCVLF